MCACGVGGVDLLVTELAEEEIDKQPRCKCGKEESWCARKDLLQTGDVGFVGNAMVAKFDDTRRV